MLQSGRRAGQDAPVSRTPATTGSRNATYDHWSLSVTTGGPDSEQQDSAPPSRSLSRASTRGAAPSALSGAHPERIKAGGRWAKEALWPSRRTSYAGSEEACAYCGPPCCHSSGSEWPGCRGLRETKFRSGGL